MTQKSSDSKTTEALARARGIALSSDGHLTRDMFGEEFVDFMREVSQAEDSDFEFRSDEAREADRAALLENHPEGEDLWIFGYGSLIWNPAVLIGRNATRDPGRIPSVILPEPGHRAWHATNARLYAGA